MSCKSVFFADRFFDDDLKYDKMIILYNFYVSKVKYSMIIKEYYSKEIALEDCSHISHYEIDQLGTEDEIHRENLYRLGLATHIHEAIAENLASEQVSI